MSNFINEFLMNKIAEKYNPNDAAQEYSEDFIKNLIKARQFDPFNVGDSDGILPAEFFAHLRDFVYSKDTELHIQYPEGHSIIIDVDVAKRILANASVEDIEYAARDIGYFHHIISNIGVEGGVVTLKSCGCESGEECSCEIEDSED